MKKIFVSFITITFMMVLLYMPDVVQSMDEPCLEHITGQPASLNYTGNPHHPLNCSYSGIGCLVCTQTPIN